MEVSVQFQAVAALLGQVKSPQYSLLWSSVDGNTDLNVIDMNRTLIVHYPSPRYDSQVSSPPLTIF
jgi:hypothetical protein